MPKGQEGEVKRLFLFQKFPEDFIDVFSMANIMDLDYMVFVVYFVNDPEPPHA
jgi:hypothetical protein